MTADFSKRMLRACNAEADQPREPRREFFTTPEEVLDVLADKVGNLLETAAQPEAEQSYQALSRWPAEARAAAP